MTTNPSTQADAAMQRIRQHINRSAGQHLRAVRSASPADTTSMTPEPLLLATERLHRVDASQLPHGTGVSLGHCRTDGIACHSRPGVMCMGDPNCHDYHCEGHPCNDATDDERDPVALRWFLAGYCGFIVTCLVGIAYADDIYHWLTR